MTKQRLNFPELVELVYSRIHDELEGITGVRTPRQMEVVLSALIDIMIRELLRGRKINLPQLGLLSLQYVKEVRHKFNPATDGWSTVPPHLRLKIRINQALARECKTRRAVDTFLERTAQYQTPKKKA